jgi:acetyltransferase-like isoleucine patch superfamily enzyme
MKFLNGTKRLAGDATIGSFFTINSLNDVSTGKQIQICDYVKFYLNHHNKALHAPQISIGNFAKIGDRNQISVGSGDCFKIGEGSSTHTGCHLMGNISIGRYCLLSANIYASSGNHFFDKKPAAYIRDQDHSSKSDSGLITIEDDCWIGWGVVIKRGITIGRGSVVGANSVVTKDVPPYSVVAGSPAKILRARLPFIPKPSVKVGQIESIPYLYRGFKSRDKEIIEKESVQYCHLDDESYIAFPKQESKKVELVLWSKKQSGIEIYYKGKKWEQNLSSGINKFELRVYDGHVSNFESLPLLSQFDVLMIRKKKLSSGEEILFSEALIF